MSRVGGPGLEITGLDREISFCMITGNTRLEPVEITGLDRENIVLHDHWK
jgi:hypothetical protein